MLHSRLIPLLLVAAMMAAALPARAYDPKLRWRSVETEHFIIHYHDGEEALAYKAARICEEIHAVLSPYLEEELAWKMHVVLTDHTDEANGYHSATPYPSVVMYMSAPLARQSLQCYEDWLWSLFVHEYTHALHINITEGIWKVLRAMFGGYMKPQRYQPGWMIEGIAVHNETAFTGGGRGRASYADMLVRMSVLDDRFIPIHRAADSTDMWPGGQAKYIWGGRFHLWVSQQYGPDKWVELSDTHAAQVIPFVLPAKKVFGKRFVTLWKEWHADLEVEYRALERELAEQGFTEAQVLTEHPDFCSEPVIAPDGEWVYYLHRHHRGPSEIHRMRPDGSDDEMINRHWHAREMSLSPDGSSLYFSALRTHKIYSAYFDLYRLDLDEQRPLRRKRLTHGARVRDPDVHPDGDRLVCVQNGLGSNELAIWTEAAGVQTITESKPYTQYNQPVWSPDGTRIAVTVWHEGGYRDIEIYDEAGQRLQRLTADRAIDIEPHWSPDGEYLLFSSDRTGIYNVFAHRLSDGELLQVTNVIAAAYSPHVTPDLQWLLYEGYTSEGTDVRRTVYDPASWRVYRELPPATPETALAIPPAQEQELPSKRYNPLTTLLPPRYLVPEIDQHNSWTAWSLGARSGGRDVLRMHEYSGSFAYRTDHEFFRFSLAYELNALHPNFRVGYYNYSLDQGKIWLEHAALQTPAGTEIGGLYAGEDRYLERRDRAYFQVSVPLHARHSVWARYQYDHHCGLRPVPDDAFLALLPGVGSYAGVQMGYQFSQTRWYRYSVSSEAGFQAGITADLQYPWLGTRAFSWTGEPLDLQRTSVTAEVRAYLSMPWWRNHVVALRAAAGTTMGHTEPVGSYRLGGHFAESSYLGTPSQGFPLHGYGAGTMQGDRLALLSVQYRLPLFFIERGVGTLPIFVRGMYFSAMFDVGQVWRRGDYPRGEDFAQREDLTLGGALDQWFGNLVPGAALEFTAEIIPAWNGILRITLGYESGLNRNGIKFSPDAFYVQLGSSY